MRRPYIDYEDDESELIIGGDRVWILKKKRECSKRRLEKQRIYSREWRLKHPERFKEIQKKYHSSEKYKARRDIYSAARYQRLKRQRENENRQAIAG